MIAISGGGWSLGGFTQEFAEGEPPYLNTTGTYEVRALSANAPVYSAFFDDFSGECRPVAGTSCSMDAGAVIELPGNATVDRLELMQGGVTLSSLQRSSHMPQVTVDSPLPGEELTPSSVVSWTATDQDGEPLTANVDFSYDGVHFAPVASFIDGSVGAVQLENLSDWPTTHHGQIIVTVSDGFNATRTVIDGVWISGNRAPYAFITHPVTGLSLPSGASLVLLGTGLDPEVGQLSGSALQWTSNLDGPLGQGNVLGITNLSLGAHTVSLHVTDPQGATADDSISVTIVP